MASANADEPASVHGPQADPTEGKDWLVFRNERVYQKDVDALFPCDDEEMDRLDAMHRFFIELCDGSLFEAPVTGHDGQTRIIDVGSGTGLWSMHMAESPYFHDHNLFVYSVDHMKHSPELIPPRCTFIEMNIEAPWPKLPSPESWPRSRHSFDYAHMRVLNGYIKDWSRLYSRVFQQLRPGGLLEHIEIDWYMECDDGTLPEDSAIVKWKGLLRQAMDMSNRNLHVNPSETRDRLDAAGFTDIREVVRKVACSPWVANSREKEKARWLNLVFVMGIQAMTLEPLARYMNWTRPQVIQLTDRVLSELSNLLVHTHCKLYTWIARKPD